MNITPIRLLIAEDHKLVLQGYEQLLSNYEDISIVATASNYYDIIHKLQSTVTDVLLLDLSMPVAFSNHQTRLSGLDILEYIKKGKLPVKVLVASTHRDYQIIKNAIALGAKGYLFKNADIKELMEAIREVNQGKTYFQKEIKAILQSKQEDESRMAGDGIKVSPREKEILQLLAEGLKGEEIAERLGLVKYTIEEYRSNLLKKFKAKNATHLIKIACDQKFI
ncbi:MAG: response regulator transcription factor [Spirosomataceae bacterium]